MTSISTFYKRTVQAGGGAEHAGPRPLEPKTRDTSYKETRVRCQQVASTPTAKWSLGREGVGREELWPFGLIFLNLKLLFEKEKCDDGA